MWMRQYVKHPLRWILPLALAMLLAVGLGFGLRSGSNTVLAPQANGYEVMGKFEVNGLPADIKRSALRQAKAAFNSEILLWGSWAGNDQNTGRLTSAAFSAPEILGLLVTGWPSAEGNQLALVRLDTGERLSLKVGSMGQRWQELHWLLPPSWYGKSVQLIATDGNANPYGWFGVSVPLQVNWGRAIAAQSGWLWLLPIYLLHFGLFLLPGFLITLQVLRRQPLAPSLTVMLAVMASSLLSYLAFWAYFLNPWVGYIFSAGVLLGSMGYTVWQYRRRPDWFEPLRQMDVIMPLSLMLLVGLMYVALLYASDTGELPEILAQTRFFGVFPPDNLLPKLFADKLALGEDPRPLLGEWLSSDRPPLQTGIVLLQHPITWLTDFRDGVHYQIAATLAQCTWIPALWALGRRLQLVGRQLALVLAFTIFSGFFLFNSIYTWPKLLAAAFVIVAFVVLLPAIESRRRPTLLEVSLAAVATGLGMLSHGGVVFTVPAIALLVLQPKVFPGWRRAVVGIALLAVLLAPWSAYQKWYEPPANRLVKWHIGGVVEIDQRSSWEAISDSYGRLSLPQIAEHKWKNAMMLVGDPNAYLLSGIPEEASVTESRRRYEFFHVFVALGVLNLGWVIYLVEALSRRWRPTEQFRRVGLVLGVSLASLLFWILIMFGPGTTSIHAGSYATMLLLYAGLATLVSQLPRWVGYALLSFQIVTFTINWIVTTTFSDPGRLLVVPNGFLLGIVLAALAGLCVVLHHLARWQEAAVAPTVADSESNGC